jgi:hypothetical protein
VWSGKPLLSLSTEDARVQIFECNVTMQRHNATSMQGCKSLNATSQWLRSSKPGMFRDENCHSRRNVMRGALGALRTLGFHNSPTASFTLDSSTMRWKGSHRARSALAHTKLAAPNTHNALEGFAPSEVRTNPRQAPCSQHPRCGRVSLRTLQDRNVSTASTYSKRESVCFMQCTWH